MKAYIKDFIKYQDGAAKGYGCQKNDLDEVLRGLVSERLNNSYGKLIEVGCGNGHFLKKMQRNKNISAYGLDFSPKMLSKAKERLVDGEKKVHLAFGDGTSMPFDNDSFDYVVGLSMLFNHPDFKFMAEIIKDMARICKKDGMIFFDLYNLLNPYIFKITKKAKESKTFYFGGKGIKYRKIKKLLKESGVRKIKRKLLFFKGRKHGNNKLIYLISRILYVFIPLIRPRYLVIAEK